MKSPDDSPSLFLEGFGFPDHALDTLIAQTGFREITHHYQPTIRALQRTIDSTLRFRVIADPMHTPGLDASWNTVTSNRDTCVVVTNPAPPATRHFPGYLLPRMFVTHFAHTRLHHPLYFPKGTRKLLIPTFIDSHQVGSDGLQLRCQGQRLERSSLFGVWLEVLKFPQIFVADRLLLNYGYENPATQYYLDRTLNTYTPIRTPPQKRCILLLWYAYIAATLQLTKETEGRVRARVVDFCQPLVAKDPRFCPAQRFRTAKGYVRGLSPDHFRNPRKVATQLTKLLGLVGINA